MVSNIKEEEEVDVSKRRKVGFNIQCPLHPHTHTHTQTSKAKYKRDVAVVNYEFETINSEVIILIIFYTTVCISISIRDINDFDKFFIHLIPFTVMLQLTGYRSNI
jgi:hypothetical protein